MEIGSMAKPFLTSNPPPASEISAGIAYVTHTEAVMSLDRGCSAPSSILAHCFTLLSFLVPTDQLLCSVTMEF